MGGAETVFVWRCWGRPSAIDAGGRRRRNGQLRRQSVVVELGLRVG